MKKTMIVAAVCAVALSAQAVLSAGGHGSLSGSYVEARTAEVFTGGCIMNSEAETMGKQAVLAWKIDRGTFNGVSLDGLSVVAALSGNRNLGMVEMGGDRPTVHSAIYVDERANAAQQIALVAMTHELTKGLVGTIVQVTPAPITFTDNGGEIAVTAAGEQTVALDVSKHLVHDPSCGAMQWFHPLSTVGDAEIGMAARNLFTGSSLGAKWSDPNKRSAFFATFSY